jgi:aldehyde dehydrogenase (NAD+)
MNSYADHYSNGAFRHSTGTARMPVLDPSCGLQSGEVVSCSAGDVERAVHSARTAFDDWAGVGLADRVEALRRLHTELGKRVDAAAAALADEIGCPIWLGKLMQMSMPLKGLELAIEGASQIQWREQVGNGVVERVPAGVIAAITPWNFPLHQIVAKVAAAIAAGCTIVLKPSEVAPGAAKLFAEAVDAARIPPGVFNLVWGGPEVGEQLVRHPDVDKISFTGSTQVGRRIMTAAAEGLKPLTLELGGKSAAVLLDDADLDAAIPMVVRMALANSGQACVCQSRLIAPRRLIPEIRKRVQDALSGWPVGLPQDPATRLGPVATRAQHDRVRSMIQRATEQGARLMTGAPKPPAGLERGYFVQPTVFEDVQPDMEISGEEVFGPVLTVMAYHDEEQAVELANSTHYGLSGAVWSSDAARAEAFARRMKTGQVILNGAPQNLATPFGGWGWSGFGRENGRFGIEDLLNYRALHGAAA